MSTITGIITDAVTSTPIEGCRVILSGSTTLFQSVSQNVLSDATGNYSFNSVPNGVYFIRIYLDGYDDYGTSFTISSTGTYTRNISLNPKHVVISSPKYFCQFTDIEESKTYRIELHKSGYAGSSTQIQKMSDTPAVISYRSLTKGDQEKIQPSELRFVLIISKANIGTYEDIFQSEYKDWRVELYVDDVLDWVGYLQPDAIDRSVFDQEISINMTATDALKDLKEYQFQTEGKISIMQAIRDAISPIGIHLPFRVKYGVRETTQAPDVLSWLTQKINTIAFATDQQTVDSVMGSRRPRAVTPSVHYKLDNCYSVLEKLLGGCRSVLRQVGGKYVIQNLHEGDTYYYEASWDNIDSATRVAANDIVDMTGKTYHVISNFSNIVPIKELHITHYNRNLGDSLANFNDFNNWTYENWEDTIINNNNVNLIWTFQNAAGRLTFNDPLYLSPITDRDYIQVSLSAMYYLDNPNISLPAVLFYIEITKPDGITYIDRDNIHWPDLQSSSDKKPLITGPSEALHINQTGEYYISIRFYWSPFPHPYVGVCTIRNVDIRQVVMAGEDKFDADVSFDTNYTAQISTGKIVEPQSLYFADTPRDTDLGVILIDDGSTLTPSALWKRDHASGEMPFVNLYALQYLSDRSSYKDYLTITVLDPDLEILPSSWILFNRDGVSRTYRIVGHSRDMMNNNLTLTLEQVLSDDVDMTINQVQLPSVSGEGGKRSASVLPPALVTKKNIIEIPTPKVEIISHNEAPLLDPWKVYDKVRVWWEQDNKEFLNHNPELWIFRRKVYERVKWPTYNAGDTLGGGKYVSTFNKGGKRYALIVGTSLGVQDIGWGTMSTDVTGQSNDVGAAITNHEQYVALDNKAGTAAMSARAVTQGGKTDWYLPTVEELNLIYANNDVIGLPTTAGGNVAFYWASSQTGVSAANTVEFSTGTTISVQKDSNVRATVPIRYEELAILQRNRKKKWVHEPHNNGSKFVGSKFYGGKSEWLGNPVESEFALTTTEKAKQTITTVEYGDFLFGQYFRSGMSAIDPDTQYTSLASIRAKGSQHVSGALSKRKQDIAFAIVIDNPDTSAEDPKLIGGMSRYIELRPRINLVKDSFPSEFYAKWQMRIT